VSLRDELRKKHLSRHGLHMKVRDILKKAQPFSLGPQISSSVVVNKGDMVNFPESPFKL
jgi:hypothetical protein